jgi:acetyltransferase-like isoleucine patch superfamily enzyme
MKPGVLLNRMLRAFYYTYMVDPPPPESQFMAENERYKQFDVGEYTYGKPYVLFDGEGQGGKLIIGRYCSLGPNVTILLGGEHHIDWITTYPFNALFEEAQGFPGYPLTRGDVVIGNDVWIGHGSLILSGVSIRDGAVVAAGSVVNKDVEPYEVVGGVPARRIRLRFPEPAIKELLETAWWNWPLPAIKEAWPLLLSSDVDAFLAKYGNASAIRNREVGAVESVATP